MRAKRILIVFSIGFAVIAGNIFTAYSYWDDLYDSQSESVTIGDWLSTSPAEQAAIDIADFISLSSDPNDDLVYSQSGNMKGLIVTLDNLTIEGIVWDIVGEGTKTPYETMGFVQIVDRTGSYPILPVAPTTPESDYFLVDDVRNTVTDNNYSIRMNYGVDMTTDQPITGLTQVSFYASRGLSATNDWLTMTTRVLEVLVSTNGNSWTSLGSVTPPSPSGSSYAFTQYTFDVPGNLLGNDLYVRLVYNGEGLKGVKTYSRVVIDELNFVTN